jgi:hypothetical protein
MKFEQLIKSEQLIGKENIADKHVPVHACPHLVNDTGLEIHENGPKIARVETLFTNK